MDSAVMGRSPQTPAAGDVGRGDGEEHDGGGDEHGVGHSDSSEDGDQAATSGADHQTSVGGSACEAAEKRLKSP